MTPTLLLLAALFGQSCSTGNCGDPQLFGGGSSMMLQPSYLQPAPAQYVPTLAQYRIRHNGLSFVVEGWQFTRDGEIKWENDRPFNVKALSDARAKRAAELATSAKPKAIIAPKASETPKVTVLYPKPAKDTEIGQVAVPIQNFGLRPDKIGHGKAESYTAQSAEAKLFIEQATSPSDGIGKLHVTVIGNDDEQARVLNDIKTDPAFDSIRDHLLVQGYKPGEWAVDPSLGFKTNGRPSIFVQVAKGPGDKKGGRVVFRTNDYAIGAKGLAEAIRKADPSYKPENDPGPESVVACPLGFTRDHLGIIAIVGVVLLVIFRLPRKAG